jgi:hypothetical protein
MERDCFGIPPETQAGTPRWRAQVTRRLSTPLHPRVLGCSGALHRGLGTECLPARRRQGHSCACAEAKWRQVLPAMRCLAPRRFIPQALRGQGRVAMPAHAMFLRSAKENTCYPRRRNDGDGQLDDMSADPGPSDENASPKSLLVAFQKRRMPSPCTLGRSALPPGEVNKKILTR